MKSVIYEADFVPNTERRLGSALEYYPAVLVRLDGTTTDLMFTLPDFNEPAERAASNKEDMPELETPAAPEPAWTRWVPWALSAAALFIAVVIVAR